MARMTQFYGLTNEANNYVKNLKPTTHKNRTLGMFDEDVLLGEWELPNGIIVREVVQAAPWSSGPCIFTCLVLYSNIEPINQIYFLWSQEEINGHC